MHAEAEAVDGVVEPIALRSRARAHSHSTAISRKKTGVAIAMALPMRRYSALDVPVARALHGLRPAPHPRIGLVARHRRLEAPIDLPDRRDLRRRRPEADAESREIRRAERRRLGDSAAARPARRAGRPGTASAGRWPSRRHRRAVRRSGCAASFCMATSTSALWKAIASSAARAMCARVVPRVRPDDRAARVGVPVRAAEAGERGHEIDAAANRARWPRAPRRRPTLDDAEAVAQPLHDGAADEHGAFERVVHVRRCARRWSSAAGSPKAAARGRCSSA